jgi:hypothetical protein
MPSDPERRVTRHKRHARVEAVESAVDRVITPAPCHEVIKSEFTVVTSGHQ